MDRLGKSLDEIIASRPKSSRGGKGGRGGGRGGNKPGGGRGGNKESAKTVFHSDRRGGKVKLSSETVIRKPFVKKAIADRVGKAASVSIFDRLGTGPSSHGGGISGTQVVFANLKSDIVSSDIAELCSNVGEVKQVDIILNKSGRSTVISCPYCHGVLTNPSYVFLLIFRDTALKHSLYPTRPLCHHLTVHHHLPPSVFCMIGCMAIYPLDQGVAEVLFARRSDAITAIKKFHGE